MLLLAGCAVPQGSALSTPQGQLIEACETWRRTKIALSGAINADLLDPSTIAPRVAMADSVCSGPLPADDAVASSVLDRLGQTIAATQAVTIQPKEPVE